MQAAGAEDNTSKVSLGRRAGVRNPATFANVVLDLGGVLSLIFSSMIYRWLWWSGRGSFMA
jgi:hypothetical protein